MNNSNCITLTEQASLELGHCQSLLTGPIYSALDCDEFKAHAWVHAQEHLCMVLSLHLSML